MKITKILSIAIGLFFSCQLFALDLNNLATPNSLSEIEYTINEYDLDSWNIDHPVLRGNRTGGGGATGAIGIKTSETPVHNGVYVLLILAGGYLIFRRKSFT